MYGSQDWRWYASRARFSVGVQGASPTIELQSKGVVNIWILRFEILYGSLLLPCVLLRFVHHRRTIIKQNKQTVKETPFAHPPSGTINT